MSRLVLLLVVHVEWESVTFISKHIIYIRLFVRQEEPLPQKYIVLSDSVKSYLQPIHSPSSSDLLVVVSSSSL